MLTNPSVSLQKLKNSLEPVLTVFKSNTSKFDNTFFVDEMKADQKINSRKFRRYNVVDAKIYEIHMAMRKNFA